MEEWSVGFKWGSQVSGKRNREVERITCTSSDRKRSLLLLKLETYNLQSEIRNIPLLTECALSLS
jgi:hypothetical protein